MFGLLLKFLRLRLAEILAPADRIHNLWAIASELSTFWLLSIIEGTSYESAF